jgi:hypothetical protein
VLARVESNVDMKGSMVGEKLRRVEVNNINDIRKNIPRSHFIQYKTKRFLSTEILEEYDVELD